MIAANIPDPYVVALIPTSFLGLISLIAFLFRQQARSNEALASVAQQLKDLGRRTERLENAVFTPFLGRGAGFGGGDPTQ